MTELGSKTYTIQHSEAGIEIRDANGNACPQDECRNLATRLAEKYAPGAYVYIGKKVAKRSDGTSTEIHKVGMTTDLIRRQAQLQIRYIHVIPCADWKSAQLTESILLQYFDDWEYRITGEWYLLDEDSIELVTRLKNSDDVIQLHRDDQVRRKATRNSVISIDEILDLKRKYYESLTLDRDEMTEEKKQEIREFAIYARQVADRIDAFVKQRRERK